jgi:hypothetical protein
VNELRLRRGFRRELLKSMRLGAGVLPKWSAPVEVGRAVLSTAGEDAKTGAFQTSADSRGALRTARPTTDRVSQKQKGSTRLWRVVCGVTPQTPQLPPEAPIGDGIRVQKAGGATPPAARETRALPQLNCMITA